MNIQVVDDPPMDLLDSIEQDISRDPKSSITTILTKASVLSKYTFNFGRLRMGAGLPPRPS